MKKKCAGFIPYGKLSKKQKAELNAAGRALWVINPVTRKAPPPGAYSRAKMKNDTRMREADV